MGAKSFLQKKEHEKTTKLPFEILVNIFSFLEKQDFEVILQCCKHWKESLENSVLQETYDKELMALDTEFSSLFKHTLKTRTRRDVPYDN